MKPIFLTFSISHAEVWSCSPMVNSYRTFVCFGSYFSPERGKEHKYTNNFVLILKNPEMIGFIFNISALKLPQGQLQRCSNYYLNY